MTNVVHITPDHILRSLDNQIFVKGRPFLRGSGIFGALGSFLLPLASALGKYLFSKGANLATQTSDNLLQGRSFKESLRDGATGTLNEIRSDIKRKLSGRGKYKRRNTRQYVDIFKK